MIRTLARMKAPERQTFCVQICPLLQHQFLDGWLEALGKVPIENQPKIFAILQRLPSNWVNAYTLNEISGLDPELCDNVVKKAQSLAGNDSVVFYMYVVAFVQVPQQDWEDLERYGCEASQCVEKPYNKADIIFYLAKIRVSDYPTVTAAFQQLPRVTDSVGNIFMLLYHIKRDERISRARLTYLSLSPGVSGENVKNKLESVCRIPYANVQKLLLTHTQLFQGMGGF